MEEREHTIKKAVLGGRQLTVVYTETYPEGDKDITVKSEIPAHKDCTDAFKKLVPHFILLTEMKESDEVSRLAARNGIENIPEEDAFKNAEVSGLKLGKNESHIPTVTLTGERFLRTGGSVSFCSPAQELESSGGEFEYPYINELNLAVQAVVYEVTEYLFRNKYAVTQTEINFEATPESPREAGPASSASSPASSVKAPAPSSLASSVKAPAPSSLASSVKVSSASSPASSVKAPALSSPESSSAVAFESTLEVGRIIDTDTGKVTPIRVGKRRSKTEEKSLKEPSCAKTKKGRSPQCETPTAIPTC